MLGLLSLAAKLFARRRKPRRAKSLGDSPDAHGSRLVVKSRQALDMANKAKARAVQGRCDLALKLALGAERAVGAATQEAEALPSSNADTIRRLHDAAGDAEDAVYACFTGRS